MLVLPNELEMIVPAIADGTEDSPENIGLTNDETVRYSRHLLLPNIGVEGQKKIKHSKVLIIGTGGLGSPLALYLAAAGVGTIGLVDFDVVEECNLQRQIIHNTRDVGQSKTASAQEKINNMNPFVEVVTYDSRLTSQNALEIMKNYDIVADATDNFQTRYLINDACVLLGKPNVYGAAFQFDGQASVFCLKEGPCLRCLYPLPPPTGLVPSCAIGGVLGVLPGIVGTIQATETIKLIVSGAKPLTGRLLVLDAWRMSFRTLNLAKDPMCPMCGENPTIHELVDNEYCCGLKTKRDSESIESITAIDLKKCLDNGVRLQIVDVREPHEWAIARFPGAVLISLGQLAKRKNELNPTVDTVLLCKSGKRSILGIRALREAGYGGRMLNLEDGLNAWARDVDSMMPVY